MTIDMIDMICWMLKLHQLAGEIHMSGLRLQVFCQMLMEITDIFTCELETRGLVFQCCFSSVSCKGSVVYFGLVGLTTWHFFISLPTGSGIPFNLKICFYSGLVVFETQQTVEVCRSGSFKPFKQCKDHESRHLF